MSENIHCTLLININKENKIKCSVRDKHNEEHIIKITENSIQSYIKHL